MNNNIAFCCTSIYPDSRILFKNISNWKHGDCFIAMDLKSSKNGDVKKNSYISVDREARSIYESNCPCNTYSRKNIAFIEAAKNHKYIFETDDDNIVLDFSVFEYPDGLFDPVKVDVYSDGQNIFKNIYSIQNGEIWARGYPLYRLGEKYKEPNNEIIKPGIIQFLVDGNPDVDAIIRLVSGANIDIKASKEVLPIAIKDQFHPFNSQATLWKSSDLHLMYLPSTCSFRMTDIYRGYIAEKIIFSRQEVVLFERPIVYQERNQHDITADFYAELDGYRDISVILKVLDNCNIEGMEERDAIYKCYELLVEINIFQKSELSLLSDYFASIT
jgi:hypothetical protein